MDPLLFSGVKSEASAWATGCNAKKNNPDTNSMMDMTTGLLLPHHDISCENKNKNRQNSC